MKHENHTPEQEKNITPPSPEELARLREETADRIAETVGGFAATEYAKSHEVASPEVGAVQEVQETGGLGTAAEQTPEAGRETEHYAIEDTTEDTLSPEEVATLPGVEKPEEVTPSINEQVSETGLIGADPENDQK